MNQELLDALNVIYEIVACAYDEIDDCSQIADREAHDKLGEQLGLMFEFTLLAAKYLADQDAEAELLTRTEQIKWDTN